MDINDNLDKNYLLQITNELYRLTLLFPKREPLRYKMRELADEVLADFVSFSQDNVDQIKAVVMRNSVKRVEVIEGFFEVARSQNWVKPSDMLSLQKEYSKIREELIKIQKEKREQIKKEIPEEPKNKEKKEELIKVTDDIKKEEKVKEVEKVEKKESAISERQKNILKVLKEKGQVQVWEIKDIFSGVSKRTLRRDFKSLLNQGLVERMGERNNTFYKIKDRT